MSSAMESAETPDDRRLSTKLQTMKFMQRSADRAKADAEKKLERRMIDESHWRALYSNDVVSDERSKVRVVYETSYLKLPSGSASEAQGIVMGRRSFNSFKQNADALKSEQDASAQQAVEDQIRSEKSKTPRPSKLSSSTAPATQSLRERNSRLKRKHE